MNAEQLSRVGEKLVKRCGSRDPFEIARQLGINVMLCENFDFLKGMYRVIKRNRFIFLNTACLFGDVLPFAQPSSVYFSLPFAESPGFFADDFGLRFFGAVSSWLKESRSLMASSSSGLPS